MANLAECEKQVIDILISIFSQTLNCYPRGENENEMLVVKKVLQSLLSHNESMFNNADAKGNLGVITSISEEVNGENSYRTVNGAVPAVSNAGENTTHHKNGSTGGNLHHLEIIKVFVLIFVISIILLTTCRMVFQLFIRFRPEKPPLS